MLITFFFKTKPQKTKGNFGEFLRVFIPMWFSIFLIIFLSVFTLSSNTKAYQSINKTNDIKKDSSKTGTNTLKPNFFFPQSELHRLGDYDLSKWVNHLPHTWVTRSPQFGQPQMLQGIATPIWMSKISWDGLQMVDPVYGVMDLNFLPTIPMDTLSYKSEIQVLNEKSTTSRPFSQVFFHSGDNGLNDVDIIFRRGFSKGVQFQAGANFYKHGGIYSNSDADIFKLNSALFIPLTQKIQLNYKFLTNRIEAGYPGAIAENFQVQFFKLHRKVLRQDHLFDLFYKLDSLWQANFQVQFHQDEREYTDWNLPWHTKEKLRWADLSAQIAKRTSSSITTFKINSQSVFASRLGQKQLKEFPLGLSLSHQFFPDLYSELFTKVGFTFYNQDWQGYFAEISSVKNLQNKVIFSSTAFYRQHVLPLGWREGRILPFENQPWPFLFSNGNFKLQSETVPEEPVIESGLRFNFNWNISSKLQLNSDFLLQQVQNLTYPQAINSDQIEFTTVPSYYSTGLFLNINFRPFKWISFTGRYQYAGIFDRQTPDLIEIPDHWFNLKMHITKYLFKNNLKANLLIFNEFLSSRWSYGLNSEFSKYLIEPLDAIPLLHLKLLFEVGDAEIFIHWNNLTNQTYAYRSQQRIPGWQFQYGVRWKFWD